MILNASERAEQLKREVTEFMEEMVYPNEKVFAEQLKENRWSTPPVLEEMKEKAKNKGLWNLFLPHSENGAGLTNVDYAHICEVMGRSLIGSEVFNCSAPDTGNMEILDMFGTDEQKEKWLKPLLEGKIRSTFSMTEPNVASSDATNIETSITRDGDQYVINGHKWWASGFSNENCKLLIVMGKTNPDAPKYEQQSMVLVPKDTPGIEVVQNLNVFGYDDAPVGHTELKFNNVRVPAENILWEEGKGFAIAQGRLGPGRIHHCMRLIGMAERALELMIKRSQSRVTFGKKLSEQGVVMDWVAQSRVDIEQARLLTLKTAYMMDTVGNKKARNEIAMIKVVVPTMAVNVIDRAIQLHGAGGISQDFPLAKLWAKARTTRISDGPDEVHKRTVARLEFKKYS